MGRLRGFCWAAALALAVMACLEFAAYLNDGLRPIYGAWPAKTDRALLLFLAGLGLAATLAGRRRIAMAAGLGSASLSLWRLVEFGAMGAGPERISPLAAGGFLLVAVATLCLACREARGNWLPSVAVLPLIGSAAFLLAFLTDSSLLDPAEVLRSISPHAALGLLLASFAVLALAIPSWRPQGHFGPRFVLDAALGGFSAVAITLWFAVILADYVSSVRRAEHQVLVAADILDDYVDRSLDSAELLTAKTLDSVVALGGVEALAASEREWRAIAAAKGAIPHINAVLVADAAGMVVFNSQGFPFPRVISISDRTYFKLHRDAGLERHIGSAVFSKSTGQPVFTYSRRISDAEGRMSGIVVASIDAAYFDDVFRRFKLGQGSVSGLLRENGDVLAMEGGEPVVGENLADLPVFGSLIGADHQVLQRGELRDGITRIIGIRRNSALGTVAFASLPLSAALSGWKTTVAITGGILLTVLGAVVLLGVLGRRAIRREEELKRRSESLAAFQDAVISSAGSAIIATRRDGSITLFNAAAERLLGWRADELVGRGTPERFHDPEQVRQRAAELSASLGRPVAPGFEVFVARLADASVDEREWVYVRKDGSKIPVQLSVTALRDSQGEVIGYLGVAIDMSARRKAERELRYSEKRLRAVVDNVVDGIVTIDAKGIVQSMNPAAERIFAATATQCVGRNVSMLMDEPHHSQHDGYLDAYLRTGIAKVIGSGREVEGRRLDGSAFPMELTVTEVDIAGRKMFVGVVRDLSERKRIERLKAEFVSTVSHELRTPLTAIRGSLSLINSGVLGDVPEEVRELTMVSEQSSERLVRLINDILDVEKIGAGEVKLDIAPVTVGALIARALADTKGYADQYGVTLQGADGCPAVRIRVDADRMIQVLANLISNAVKFSPRGGTVTVAAVRMPGGWVRFSVIDKGPGIAEEFRSQLFERFAQADASDAKVKGGTGLGLAITKGLVEKMGGVIGFDTEIGRGTAFHVDFPALDEAPLRTSAYDPSRKRMLHVEDDDATRLLLSRLMGNVVEVVGARSVEEAMGLAQSQPFDFAVVDLGLPDGNGIEIVPYVEDAAGHPAPVVLFSASDDLPADLPSNVVSVLVKSRASEQDLAEILRTLAARQEASA